MLADPQVSRALYGLAILLNLGLTAFGIQLAAGNVPIPEGWAWVVPILIAVVTGACGLLPRYGSEPLAQQVNALKAQGVAKRDMLVVSKFPVEE